MVHFIYFFNSHLALMETLGVCIMKVFSLTVPLTKIRMASQKTNVPDVRTSQSRSRRNRRTVVLKPPGYQISVEVTLALLREGHRERLGHVPRGSPRSKRRKVGGII